MGNQQTAFNTNRSYTGISYIWQHLPIPAIPTWEVSCRLQVPVRDLLQTPKHNLGLHQANRRLQEPMVQKALPRRAHHPQQIALTRHIKMFHLTRHKIIQMALPPHQQDH